MANKFSELAGKTKESMVRVVTDKRTKDAAERAKEAAIASATEATKVGKKFVMSELGKSMVIPAVIGALVAIPIPFFGPPLGALIGAAIGFYLYSIRPAAVPKTVAGDSSSGCSAEVEKVDIYAELAKLDVLKRSGVLSEEEFSVAKNNLLKKEWV